MAVNIGQGTKKSAFIHPEGLDDLYKTIRNEMRIVFGAYLLL